jgi:hypothetical protein
MSLRTAQAATARAIAQKKILKMTFAVLMAT